MSGNRPEHIAPPEVVRLFFHSPFEIISLRHLKERERLTLDNDERSFTMQEKQPSTPTTPASSPSRQR